MNNVLTIDNLKVSYKSKAGSVQAVKGVSFSLKKNELLALVGGSGCGKTTICKAISGLLGKEAIIEGSINMKDDIRTSMVFQDPYLSLDPSQSIGKQVEETVRIHMHRHSNRGKHEVKRFAREKALELLSLVGIENAEKRYKDIPLSFSGGMRQRIAIAIALAAEPDIIIADELTSSLDIDNSEQIINLLNSLRDRLGTSIILVTHDLGIVENHCDRVLVMKEGLIVEEGGATQFFSDPEDEYTKDLMRYAHYGTGTEHTHGDLHFHDGRPHSHEHKNVHEHKYVEPAINRDKRLGHIPHVLEIENVSKSYRVNRKDHIDVLKNVSFNIHKGELLGLSGKSGVGKTTLAKCIVGLEQVDSGNINFRDELKNKRNIQMIFQDSKSALNPRMSVRKQIEEAIRLKTGYSDLKPATNDHHGIDDLIDMVELDKDLLPKRPYEISGGQRQRGALAKALALSPKLLIADEPIASLDKAAQAQMIHLIKKIQNKNDLTVLLISHDIPMLMHVSDRIISLD